ncbi:MAG: DUF364 domain-containing protein [Gordonibacter sp.]
MGCPEKDCCAHNPENDTVSFPGTYDHDTPWKFYNHLIMRIPEDILVRDYCLGTHWSYVEADCGMGVSFTCKGGAKRTHTQDLRGLPLRQVAELAKSWCFEEATLGVAALNAYYARRELLDPLGATYDEPIERPDGTIRKMDAFELYRPRIEQAESKNVTVIGHFPHVDRIEKYANLTVLERNCTQALDTPDPACEYLLPAQDFVFMTGVTIINKTAPRLLDLAQNATVVMVGPSVVMSPYLFDWGVEMLAGSVVADPDKARFAVMNGAGQFFGEALQMSSIVRKRD